MAATTEPERSARAAFTAERDVAVAAATEAGALLRARFHQDYGVRAKGDRGDVVTELDTLAERVVVGRIRDRFPHDRILAEESGELDGEPGGGDVGRRTWLVDPLDGTNNVVIGLPAYVVGIALCVDGLPVLGVVHDPVSERTWSAMSGHGTQGPSGPVTGPCHPPSPAGPLLAWTQGHAVPRDDPTARSLKTLLDFRAKRLLQLWAPLLAWVMLARGDIDGFIGYRPEMIDLPAGALLALEAGLEIRHLDGGVYNGAIGVPDTRRSFVAGRPDVVPYLLDLVAESNRTRVNRS